MDEKILGVRTHLQGQLIASIAVEPCKIDATNLRAQARGYLDHASCVVEERPRVWVRQSPVSGIDVFKRSQGRVVLVLGEHRQEFSIFVRFFLFLLRF